MNNLFLKIKFALLYFHKILKVYLFNYLELISDG